MESSGKDSVIQPLLAIEREDVTGVLEFRALGIATQIYCRSGEIVFASGGTLSETLGRMLIRAGRLTEDQVAAVIRKLTDAIVDGEQVKFGEILVEYGFMTGDELEIALCQQVREKILGCVHRGDGEWKLTRNDKRVNDVGSYIARTRPALVQGMLRLSERRVESILLIEENRYPEIVAPEAVVAAEFELTKGEAAVLVELDGTATMQFILSKAPSDTMAPLIAALVLGGGVQLKTSPVRVARGDTRSIPPDFRTLRRAVPTFDESAAFTKPPVQKPSIPRMGAVSDPLVKEGLPPKRPSYSTMQVPVPPSQRRSSRQSLAPPASDVMTRSREAFERLKADLDQRKPASKRMRWPDPKDDTQSRLMAESAFHQGRMWLHAEEAERALPGLHRALELRSQEHEYELYVKWAQMLVNDTFKDDAQRASIQALAIKLVRENRDCELGHSILGHCAHHDGFDEAALRFFQRASQLDPKLVDAARLARLLAQRAGNDNRNSRPDIRTPRRSRNGLDPAIDEIVPSMANKPLVAPTPSEHPRATGANRKFEDGVIPPPGSGRTWDGIGAPAIAPVGSDRPPRMAPPPIPRKNTPEPITAIAVAPITHPMPFSPTPLDVDEPHAADEPMPHTQILPAPTPAAPPPVAPIPSGPPPPPAGGTHSLPMPSNASIPSLPAGQPWHVTPSVPPPPAPPPYDSHRAIPTIPPAARSARREAELEPTVTVKKRKSKTGLVIGLFVTLGVTGALAFFVGTKVLAPKGGPEVAHSGEHNSDPHDTTTTTTAVTPTPSSTPSSTPSAAVSVAATPKESPSGTPSQEPDPVVSSSAKLTLTKPAPKTGTGVVKVKKSGWGHRVFIDGQLAGQGGKDITWQCGSHRIKNGSAGKENTVDIPCGGSVEID